SSEPPSAVPADAWVLPSKLHSDLHTLRLQRNQALGRLVPVRSTACAASTPGLSTWSSSRGLTPLRDGRSHLRAGFALRCFQRLSVPALATQLYPWRDNWYTSGPSTPVLSY